MAAYITISGDTFGSISRKQYGTEQEAGRIARANPGLSEPFVSGLTIIVPPIPNAPQNQPQKAQSNNPNEVALLIEGERFRFWNSIKITREIDRMDTIAFGTPFEPDAPGFRETFRPLDFKPLSVTIGGEPFFTGTMVKPDPVLENDRAVLSVSGYSLPGVLNDCTAPASAYPLEFNNQTLKEIAGTLAGLFGLSVDFEGEPGPVFERVALEPSKKVLSFLTDLATQRNFIINSTERGALRFFKPATSQQPVARLRQGVSPLLSVAPTINPQRYYSHITGIQPVGVGLKGSQFTKANPFLKTNVRPFTFKAPDTLDSEISTAVDSKIGRMFANVVSYSVAVSTWRDPSGELWLPGTGITLLAPSAMVYSEYTFTIRSVEFDKGEKSETAVLNLILPGSLSGQVPEALPWD